MFQGTEHIAAMDEDQAAQKQQARPTSEVQMSGTMAEMQPSQMSGDFKRALDIVVPATLVIKWAPSCYNSPLRDRALYIKPTCESSNPFNMYVRISPG